jgi:uncharacterized coiled-coil protein SlyX
MFSSKKEKIIELEEKVALLKKRVAQLESELVDLRRSQDRMLANGL